MGRIWGWWSWVLCPEINCEKRTFTRTCGTGIPEGRLFVSFQWSFFHIVMRIDFTYVCPGPSDLSVPPSETRQTPCLVKVLPELEVSNIQDFLQSCFWGEGWADVGRRWKMMERNYAGVSACEKWDQTRMIATLNRSARVHHTGDATRASYTQRGLCVTKATFPISQRPATALWLSAGWTRTLRPRQGAAHLHVYCPHSMLCFMVHLFLFCVIIFVPLSIF